MSVAIKIENVSKLYRLGTVGTGTISHDLNRWWHQIRGKEDPYAKVGQVNDRTKAASDEKRETSSDSATPSSHSSLATSDSYVWALRHINLEVQQGEILGIIGRNGAGKSTLLKLLSRVTAPTTGSIKTKGRIASLLEVGTGFHPELTGRENIYMNGAILGMRRREITRRLDEIVEFSGCAKYVDTPVKRYSSGMMVRLGFAVAAHLDCEILIVDEVLAVGDVDFQRKCIGVMEGVANSGRTVLIVSHNLALIEQLCKTAILVANGTLQAYGTNRTVIEQYASSDSKVGTSWKNLSLQTAQLNSPHFLSLELDRECRTPIRMGDNICLSMQVCAPTGINKPWVGVRFRNLNGELVSHIANRESGFDLRALKGTNRLTCTIRHPNLQGGTYIIDAILADAANNVYHHVENAFRVEIQTADVFRSGMPMGSSYGVCFFESTWEVTDDAP